jgi:hypothetical protein
MESFHIRRYFDYLALIFFQMRNKRISYLVKCISVRVSRAGFLLDRNYFLRILGKDKGRMNRQTSDLGKRYPATEHDHF